MKTPQELIQTIRRGRRDAQIDRVFAYIAVIGQILLTSGCWIILAHDAERWAIYLVTLLIPVAWKLGVQARLNRAMPGDEQQLGRYTRQDLNLILEEAVRLVEPSLRRVRLHVGCEKETNAAALLAYRTIFLTSGSVHYLDREELKAVMLHEIGHYAAPHARHFQARWLARLLLFHALANAACVLTEGVAALACPLGLMGLFDLLQKSCMRTWREAIVEEHMCDFFAAERVGIAPMINALLKLGEEAELVDTILLRAGRNSTHRGWLGIHRRADEEEMVEVLEEVRPPGRIFHENLFKHASEVLRVVVGAPAQKGCDPCSKPGPPPNRPSPPPLPDGYRKPRIRWRRFDADGDGTLTIEEIHRLCETLLARPDHELVRQEADDPPLSHPPVRERILALYLMARQERKNGDATFGMNVVQAAERT